MLALLDVKVQTLVLPAAVQCPLCHGHRLYVYQDARFGGQWTHCRDCNHHGDMIELAASVWKLDLPQTLARLSLEGLALPADAPAGALVNYQASLAYRKRIEDFWAASQRRLYDNEGEDETGLQRRYCVRNLQRALWPHGGWDMVGWASRGDIEAAFKDGPAWPNPFKGTGWKQLLVLPFYSLPGRLCGFYCVGRRGERDDRFFRPVFPYKGEIDAGLGLLPGLLAPPNPHLGNTLFVMSTPLLALQLQLLWLKANTKPLPLVCSFQDDHVGTGPIWDAIGPRELAFWSPHSDPHLLRQARRTNGKIAVRPLGQTTIQRHLSCATSLDWLRIVRNKLISWPAYLESALQPRPIAEFPFWLRLANFTPADLREFTARCPQDLREKLESYIAQQQNNCSTILRNQTIQESEAGWTIVGTDENICSVRIRIDQEIRTRSGRGYYRGHVLVGTRQIPFVEKIDVVESVGLLTCLRSAVQAVANTSFLCDTRWNKLAHIIAAKLHPPEVITGVDRVGWEPESTCFNFPTYSILAGGEVVTHNAALFADTNIPATKLGTPGIVLERDLRKLSHAGESFWVTVAALISNIVAPIFDQPRTGLVICEHAKTSTLAIARALGCLTHIVPGHRPLEAMRILKELTGRHNWPVVLQTAADRTNSPANGRAWITEPGPKNCILLSSELAARVAYTHGWHFLDLAYGRPIHPDVEVAASRLLPSYLQDLCRRRFDLLSQPDPLIVNILTDLTQWLQDRGSLGFNLANTLDRLMHQGRQPAWGVLFDLISLLPSQRILLDPPQAGSVWIPQARLNTLLSQRGAPVLDGLAITQALHNDRVLCGEESYGNDRCWVVPAKWWNTEREVRRALATSRLRIVT